MRADIKCPKCNSEAIYKFGKAKNGKQRFICQVCNRQFVAGKSRLEVIQRPACPNCGKPMHVYMRAEALVRYRCRDYPKCKTYQKLTEEELKIDELLHSQCSRENAH